MYGQGCQVHRCARIAGVRESSSPAATRRLARVKGAVVKRALIGFVAVLVLVAGVFTAPGATAQDDEDYEATIEALETQLADLEGTVTARGEKINDQRTQIAELREQVPEPTQAPEEATLGEEYEYDDFAFRIISVETPEFVGDAADPTLPQGKFVIIVLEITNNGNSPGSFPTYDFNIRDSEGRVFSGSFEASFGYLLYQGESLNYGEIQPSFTGNDVLGFDVPTDATGLELIAESAQFQIPLGI